MEYCELMVKASNMIDLLEANGLSKDSIIKEVGLTSKEFDCIKECDNSQHIGEVYDYKKVEDLVERYNDTNGTSIKMSDDIFVKVKQEYMDNDSYTDATEDVIWQCLCTVLDPFNF